MFFLRAEGFSCSLWGLYGGLGITKLHFLFKICQIFSAIHFFQSLVFKTLNVELDPDPQLGKMLGLGSGSTLNQCGSTTLVGLVAGRIIHYPRDVFMCCPESPTLKFSSYVCFLN
jgi:hypothetical protein